MQRCQCEAYLRLVMSFDPRDTIEDMAGLAQHLGVADREDWIFAVAQPADLRRLSDSIGFWFQWDASRQQYDHPALLAGITRGRVVRLLPGVDVTTARLTEVTRELKDEFVAAYPLPGRVRFRCFQYDPSTGRSRVDWGFAAWPPCPWVRTGITSEPTQNDTITAPTNWRAENLMVAPLMQ